MPAFSKNINEEGIVFDGFPILVNGKVTIERTGQELLKNQDIQAAYLEGGVKN